MRVAIVGAGFTGLSAAHQLSKNRHSVDVFEKEGFLGGLAGTFRLPGWSWELEKHYHHWFTNDSYALDLIEELGLKHDLLFPKTQTSVYYNGSIYPFNSPKDVLLFTPLSFVDRIRTGVVTAYLKMLPKDIAVSLEKITAYEWLSKKYGEHVFQILWKPLLDGKFGPFAKSVNMAWFWARIKKRTPLLGYLAGGYHRLLEAMAKRIEANGGTIHFNKPFAARWVKQYDATIITTPSKIFTTMFPHLPTTYRTQLTTIPHLHALNLLLITKEPLLPDVYWLNVNDRSFPFIAVVQHTNMVDPKHYGGNHITWIGNYLPQDHPYLKMSKQELFELYKPYLQKINPLFNFQFSILNSQLFTGPFAQPVFPINYSRIKSDFVTPIKNVYLANMGMVYPWDRGTNYAIELGYKVAEIVEKKLEARNPKSETNEENSKRFKYFFFYKI